MLLLGIDLGTTGTKAVLVDDRGAAIASATREHPLSTPRPGWSEQDPESWWRSACEAVRAVTEMVPNGPKRVHGIGLSGQMHGLVMLDGDGAVLRPCILWNDQRSAPQCARVERELGLATLIELTGNRMLPGFTAPKILWCREHEPDLERRARMHLLPKDWLRHRMSGVAATEVSDASGTALFDCGGRRWSETMLKALAIDPSTMPTCAESSVVTSRLSASAATALGLAAGIPIVGGAGDQAASAIGAGIVREGPVSVTIGTSGVAFATCDRWRPSPTGAVHAFCHAVTGRWHVMGVMLGCGGCLRWYRDTFGYPRDDHGYERIVEEATASEPGARGATFLPYLVGERCPHPDPDVRGAFLGLDATHTRQDLSRAVLEGITFGLCDNLDLVRDLGVSVSEVRLAGGGARSGVWRQLCADAFEAPVAVSRGNEGGALGVALLAGVGIGMFPSIEQAASLAESVVERIAPRTIESLRRARRRHRAAYPLIRPFASAGG